MTAPIRSVSHALAQEIHRRDAHTYGVVGNGNIHLVSELCNEGAGYTGMRHEAGAVAAADAHYRSTGRVAVATTTYGPGFTNSLTPLSEALAARIPLVYVAGIEPFIDAKPAPRAMDVDTLGVLKALRVRTIIADPATAGTAIYSAFEFAQDARQPVVVAVPHNVVDAPLESSPDEDGAHEVNVSTIMTPLAGADLENPRDPESSSDPVKAAAQGIIEALRAAQRPLILVGRGVVDSRTEAQAQQLGDELGALFATSAMARNAVDPHWNLGVCGGFAHRGRLSTFQDADVVLVLGASMNLLQMRKGTILHPEARIIRVDWDPAPDATPLKQPFIPVDELHSIPLEQLLPAMLLELAESREDQAQVEGQDSTGLAEAGPRSTWRESIGELPEAEREDLDPGCFAQRGEDGLLDPRYVLRQLDELLPAERSVVTDGGHFLGWVPKYLQCPDPRGTVLVGGAVMTIGLGLASATGVAVARPDRFTALISGDGGTQMALADLGPFFATAHGAGGALVVMNDSAYGAEVHQYAPKGLAADPMLLPNVNFAEMGRAFGVDGLRVTEPEQLLPGGDVARFLEAHHGTACILDVQISRLPVADFLKE